MRHSNIFLFIGLFLFPIIVFGQQNITLEDIWQEYRFYPRSVPGFNFLKDGKHYSQKEGTDIVKYDITTGKKSGVIFEGAKAGISEMDSYSFSDDEQKILIKSKTESIYRRSTRAVFHVWDGSKSTQVSELGKIRYATFSPDASKVAFVFGNNLYVKDLASGKETQITDDGKQNSIINGATDWVYEEEFSFARAFWWSPDSKKVAFLRFDESEVKEFTMTLYKDDVYPEYETFKYPKVGEKNAIVSAHIHNVSSGKTVKIKTPTGLEYIPRLKWTENPDKVCVFQMNRWQNELELVLADANTGSTTSLLKEKNKYYIDIHDNLTFIKSQDLFVWTSEKDGYNHIYLYDLNGRLKKQITKGDWEVSRVYGVDEKNGRVFFQSTEESPLERYIYCVDFKGKKKRLTKDKGWHTAQFSSTFEYYVNTYSNANSPNTYTVYTVDGKKVRTIEDNQRIKSEMKNFNVQPVEFLSFKTSEGVKLNAWMIKPPNFNPEKMYPLFMTEYGGPGSQQVTNKFGGFNYWWYQMLAQKGYVVACVDNRGTGGRGEEFKKMTYLQLGKYETIDQIEGAKHFGKLPYIDEERIGIFGWSYGGYLSSLCILKGNETFKAAIAVAPVTNWKWYDTIYTERYMRDEKENEKGYKENSPVYFADRLKGHYLLIHGIADDNVHFQNTTEMANALIIANKQFDTYVYPNRNHGIYGGLTRLHLYTKMTDFLLEKL